MLFIINHFLTQVQTNNESQTSVLINYSICPDHIIGYIEILWRSGAVKILANNNHSHYNTATF